MNPQTVELKNQQWPTPKLECKSCHHRKWIPVKKHALGGRVACDMTGMELSDFLARKGGQHPDCPLGGHQ